jgi:hypothetical protein
MGLDTDFTPVGDVPIPAALPLLGSALGAFGLIGRMRRKAKLLAS